MALRNLIKGVSCETAAIEYTAISHEGYQNHVNGFKRF